MSFGIDPHVGTVTLPNGCVISSRLTQDEFRASEYFATADERDAGTRPFVQYHFTSGEVEGKLLLASLWFYEQMLLFVELTAIDPGSSRDWADYSLEAEAETKRFHEHLLTRILEEPTTFRAATDSEKPLSVTTLNHPSSWRFPWGSVDSFHDSRGGGTYFRISYGNRKEEANKAYRSGKKGTA